MGSSLKLRRFALPVFGAGVFLAASAEPGCAQEACVARESADPCVNVRPEPTTHAEPFRCLAPGVQVTVIESVPYWREIRLADGSMGWAAKKFLEPTGTVASEPASVPIPADAWGTIERWRQDYNRVRSHSSLGNLTPKEFVHQQAESATSQWAAVA